MLLAFTVYHLAGQVVQALPFSKSVIDPRSLPNHCDDLHQCRTIWDIIWSCLATIFACTWIALHLNIPGLKEKWYTIALGKAAVMLLALIAPEIVVMWAMRQWLVAHRIAKKYKEYEWTQTHGFFALMGGFMRFDGDKEPYTLSPKDLGPHLRNGEIDITKNAINDRSKGDILSKGFAILQTGWFIFQCIARKIQHLPVTELEVVTLGFAILNFATYWLWWNKPLDVRDPFPVRNRPTSNQGGKEADEGKKVDGGEDTESDDESNGWDIFKLVVESVWNAIRKVIVRIDCIIRKVPGSVKSSIAKVPGAIKSGIEIVCKVPGATWRAMRVSSPSDSWNTKRALSIVTFVLLIPFIPVALLAAMLWTMGTGGNSDTRSDRSGLFYSGELKRGEYACAVFVAGLFAVIFGAVHCIAWSFEFPTPTEQLLWRISSLAITCVPALLLVMDWLDFSIDDSMHTLNHDTHTMEGSSLVKLLLGVVLILLSVSLSILYILGRVALLVMAFVSLRSLPPDAYRTVHWTNFIPHI